MEPKGLILYSHELLLVAKLTQMNPLHICNVEVIYAGMGDLFTLSNATGITFTTTSIKNKF